MDVGAAHLMKCKREPKSSSQQADDLRKKMQAGLGDLFPHACFNSCSAGNASAA